MISSINTCISFLSQFVAWLGSFSIDGDITFLTIAIWFLILRLVPVLMNMIGQLSKNHMFKNSKKIRGSNERLHSNSK